MTTFKGLNQTSSASENEFTVLHNMSNDDYPALSTRKPYGKLADIQGITHMLAREDGIYYIKEWRESPDPPATVTKASFNFLAYGDDTPDVIISSLGTDVYITSLTSFGAYILIFGRDLATDSAIKKYHNTLTGETANIDKVIDTDGLGATTKFEMCQYDGTVKSYVSQATPPSSPSNGDYWFDTTTSSLKTFDSSRGAWVSVVTPYVKVSFTSSGHNITSGLFKNDSIRILGYSSVSQISNIPEYNIIHTIDYTSKFIVITGFIPTASLTTTGHLQFRREIPEMDFAFEHEGRLWGCNSEHHEIYASALGSFLNFSTYEGIESDSWATTVASDGDFTGGCSYRGYPIFFKADKVYKIFGSTVSDFALSEIHTHGSNSHTSIKEVNGTLFYRSHSGICAYTGSYATIISRDIPNAKFGALGGKYGDKYIIASESIDGMTYVYDTLRGTWTTESLNKVSAISSFGNETYISANGSLLRLPAGEAEYIEKNIGWQIESAKIGLRAPDNKSISGIKIRVSADKGTRFIVSLIYDGSGIAEKAYTHDGKAELKSIEIPLVTRRCDYFQYRIEGTGGFKLQSVAYNLR